MKKIILFVVVLVALAFAGSHFDIPYLNQAKGLVGKVTGSSPSKTESADTCDKCEQICSDRYRECLRENNCDEFGNPDNFRECSDKCLDRYRACYLGCSGKFGKEKCPQPSLSGVF